MPSLSASGSHASPIPSLSASSWPEFGTLMQLSARHFSSLHGRFISGHPSRSLSNPHKRPSPAQPTLHLHLTITSRCQYSVNSLFPAAHLSPTDTCCFQRAYRPHSYHRWYHPGTSHPRANTRTPYSGCSPVCTDTRTNPPYCNRPYWRHSGKIHLRTRSDPGIADVASILRTLPP